MEVAIGMDDMDDQTHYAVLDIRRDATPQDVVRAYQIARATYEPGSNAAYSLLTDEESAEWLRRVENAYAVLSDAQLRREYDARLRTVDITGAHEGHRRTIAPPAPPPRDLRPAPEPSVALDEGDEPDDGVYDGEALRRIRMRLGIEIEEIANITKIGPAYLRFIEANRYDALPQSVYLRGFLREIARCLRLDPKLVAETYMKKKDTAAASK
jgi:curved DNA-binding protein CbpA